MERQFVHDAYDMEGSRRRARTVSRSPFRGRRPRDDDDGCAWPRGSLCAWDPGNRPDHLATDDLDALRGCRAPWPGQDRRGRPARGRHRQAHGPLAQGQVHRPRARLARSASGGAATARSTRRASTSCATRSSRSSSSRSSSTSSTRTPAPIRSTASPCASSRRCPYHALFAKTMFIEPTAAELDRFTPDALVLHAPEVESDPKTDDGRARRPSSCCIRTAPSCSSAAPSTRARSRSRSSPSSTTGCRSRACCRCTARRTSLATARTSRSSSASPARARRRFPPILRAC